MSSMIPAMKVVGRTSRWLIIPVVILGALALAVPARADGSHTISVGETLTSIANRYGVNLSELAALNGISNVNRVYAGDTLSIPGTSESSGSSSGAGSHRISPGENLTSIAALYGLTVSAIANLNGIVNPNHIVSGQVLSLPGGSSSGGIGGAAPPPASSGNEQTHTVSPGDNLSTIAQRYGVAIAALVSANDLNNPNRILIGQLLRIPGITAPANDRATIERELISAEQEFGLPHGLLRAVAWQESGWQQHVVSSAGAVGVAQIMPGTAAWLLDQIIPEAVNWRTDARDNIRMGAALLRFNLQWYGWDLNAALAAYYQGAGNIQRYGIFEDTRGYIANIREIMTWY